MRRLGVAKHRLDAASELKDTRTANLRWKHGGKTSEELKAEGK